MGPSLLDSASKVFFVWRRIMGDYDRKSRRSRSYAGTSTMFRGADRKSLAGNGELHLGHTGFVLGAWTRKFSRVASVTRERASTRFFNVSSACRLPGKWRGLMQCPIGFAMPVSGASGNERFHDLLLMGWRVYYKSSRLSCA